MTIHKSGVGDRVPTDFPVIIHRFYNDLVEENGMDRRGPLELRVGTTAAEL